MTEEQFLNKLNYLFSFQEEIFLEDDDEVEHEWYAKNAEIFLGSTHQLPILNANDITNDKDFYAHQKQKVVENIDYKIIGMSNIHVLKEDTINDVDFILYFFSYKSNYYLIKCFADTDFESHSTFSEAMKSSTIEKLIQTIPNYTINSSFSKEDKEYLSNFLEKEQFEKNIQTPPKQHKKIKV